MPLRQRVVILLAIGVLLVAGVWLLTDPEPPISAPPSPSSSPSVVVPPATTTTSRPASRPTAGISASAFDREGLEALPIPEFESPLTSGLELVVVGKDTGTPIPSAEIMIIDFGFMDPEFWTRRNIDRRDPEDVVRSLCRRWKAGPDGRAFVPWPRESSVILVRAKSLFAAEFLDVAYVASPVTLEAAPDTVLRAKVLDVAGEPLAGCPVDFTAITNDGGPWEFVRVKTDDDGIAAAKNFDRYVKLFRFAPRGEVRLGFPVADKEATRVAFEFDPWPADPIELRAPPFGSVVVDVVDDTGAPVAKDGFARLSVRSAAIAPGSEKERKPKRVREGVREGSNLRARVIGGRADFPMVETGLRLSGGANFLDGSTAGGDEINGPLADGETVQLLLVRPKTTPTVVLRPVGPGGFGFAGARLEVRGHMAPPGSEWVWSRRVTVDGEGLLRTDVGEPIRTLDPVSSAPPPEPKPIRELRLVGFDGNIPKWRGTVAVPPSTEESIDLGVVELTAGETLVSGTVTDETNAPVRSARIDVEREGRDAEGRPTWGGVEMRGFIADADGRFNVSVDDPSGSWRARATRPGYRSPNWVEFKAGAKLDLKLERGCRVEGNVLLDPEMPPRHVQARLVIRRPDGTENAPEIFNNAVGLDALGGFRWSGLPAGVGTLLVGTHGGQPRERSLAVIDGIVLTPGVGSTDPRLVDIDLRGKLRKIVVTVLDPAGRPTDATVRVLERGGAVVSGRSPLTLLVPPQPADLRIEHGSYRTEFVEDATADVTVRLRPPHSVYFLAPNGVEWPPGGDRLGIRVSFDGDPKHAPQLGRPTLLNAPRGGDAVFGSDGTVKFSLNAPARMRVRWFVERTGPDGKPKLAMVDGRPEEFAWPETDGDASFTLKPPGTRALSAARAALDR